MVSYPPKGCEITFREPFPQVHIHTYDIKASIDDEPETLIRLELPQQKEIIDYLLLVDLKLTGAKIRCDSMDRFVVLKHSP